jgi:RNA polymerase sigma-70 factor (ECF subfamily)
MQYISKRVSNRQDAEDLLQEVYVRALESSRGDNGIENVTAWLFRIAHNVIVDKYRSTSRIVLTDDIDEVPSSQLGPDNYNQETGQCLRQLAEHLSPLDREAILAADYQGNKQGTLSRRWGVSLSGGKSRIQRARQRLKTSLLDCCEVKTDGAGNILDLHIKGNNYSCS